MYVCVVRGAACKGAQAHLKLGNYEAALERCDVAIRADERCVKAHHRRGIALRSMGEYEGAIKSFAQARKLAPSDQRKTFDRHIEETEIAQKIAARELELDTTMKDGSDAQKEAFKTIERGTSKLCLPALKAADFLSIARELLTTITNPLHQDLFRLRKGTRLLADSQPCKTYLQIITTQGDQGDPGVSADPKDEKMSIDEWGVKGGGCTIMTLRLLATAIKDNEASCRDVFKLGAKDNRIFTQLINYGGDRVREEVMNFLRVAAQNAHVRRSIASPHSEQLVDAILNVCGTASFSKPERVSAGICYSMLAAEDTFRVSCRQTFEDDIWPRMISLLDAGGSLAEAGLLALTNLVIDEALRQRLAQDDSFARIFAFAHYWSKPILDGVFKEQDERNQAARLYSLLGLTLNLTLEPTAQTWIQRPPSIDLIVQLMKIRHDKVHARAAALLARVCTTKMVAEHLAAHRGMQQLIEMCETCQDHEFLDATARTAFKVVSLYPASRSVVASERGLRVWCNMLHNDNEKVVGNAALCLSECARDQQVCMDLVGTTVVADLLNLARRDKSKLTENCAIALARLASGHPEHTGRLRQLGGFEVLHSRAPKQ